MTKQKQIVNRVVDGTLVVSVEGRRVRVVEGQAEPIAIAQAEGDFQFLPGRLLSAAESKPWLGRL